MSALLKERFDVLLCDKQVLSTRNSCWEAIESGYLGKKRFYHNLTHLQNLFSELELIRAQINDWETISWSVFFHDIIYNIRKQDNEALSAEEAVKWLKLFELSEEKIALCKAQIIATKSHDFSNDNDTNLFTDADLSILGKDWNTYEKYVKAIRKEYHIYPNTLYKPARKKVLLHFLEMPRIYKTDTFYNLYEEQARKNIGREIAAF